MITHHPTSQYVVESENPFLTLWPHRYDYIWAEHPAPGEKPHWQTESRHPLADRLIGQGSYLYGVRFSQETQYALIDIDIGSPYHPRQDALAVDRILAVLEEKLHLTAYVVCQSSYSGGLHLYLPLANPLPTFELATAVAGVLEQAGFRLVGGQLEIFPNRKPFSHDGSVSLYQGHRLPLQSGSYLLGADWQPIYSSQLAFVERWRWAAQRNTLGRHHLKRVLKTIRRPYRITQKAAKFLNDLNAEIEAGWTGCGQTNRLLGRIAMRAYVFGHTLLSREQPLSGPTLIQTIIETAQQLPGFKEFCNHQQDLAERAADWARCVENSHYYPYGRLKPLTSHSASSPSWNQQQQQQARERIRQQLAQLQKAGRLPSQVTARFNVLASAGISGQTLYKHKDLWHPAHASLDPDQNHPNHRPVGEFQDSPTQPTSLLGGDGCNPSSDKTSSDGEQLDQVRQAVMAAREQVRQQQRARQRQRNLDQFQRHWQKMMGFLRSEDPILVAEAERWLYRQGYA